MGGRRPAVRTHQAPQLESAGAAPCSLPGRKTGALPSPLAPPRCLSVCPHSLSDTLASCLEPVSLGPKDQWTPSLLVPEVGSGVQRFRVVSSCFHQVCAGGSCVGGAASRAGGARSASGSTTLVEQRVRGQRGGPGAVLPLAVPALSCPCRGVWGSPPSLGFLSTGTGLGPRLPRDM